MTVMYTRPSIRDIVGLSWKSINQQPESSSSSISSTTINRLTKRATSTKQLQLSTISNQTPQTGQHPQPRTQNTKATSKMSVLCTNCRRYFNNQRCFDEHYNDCQTTMALFWETVRRKMDILMQGTGVPSYGYVVSYDGYEVDPYNTKWWYHVNRYNTVRFE